MDQRDQRRFGAVIFDDPEEHADGWACAWDVDPAQRKVVRVSGPHELPSDTSWITNLSYDVMRVAQLGGSRFRNDAFLSNKIGVILNECGLGDGIQNVNRIAPTAIFDGRYATAASARTAFIAWTFHSVLREAAQFMPIDAPPVADLASLYRESLLPPASIFYNKDLPNDLVQTALTATDTSWTPAASGMDRQAGRTVRLPLDRVTLCRTLLNVVYPLSGWKLDTDVIKALNKRPVDDIMRWFDGHPEALVKVTMRRTDPRYESLVNYGANVQNNRLAGQWLVSSEAARLWGPCDLTIHAAITANRSTHSRAWIEAKGLVVDDALWERKAGSYAFQLWADTLWRGLCKAPLKSPHGMKSPAYTFVRAVDREICFYAAVKVQEAGLTVKGYGSGSVHIFLPDDLPVHQWIPIVLQAGLTPPLLAPGVLQMDWVSALLDLQNGQRPSPRTLLHAALLLGELETIITLSDILSQQG